MGKNEEELDLDNGREGTEPHITLHALSGHSVGNSLRLQARIKGKLVSVLIDSGRTG